MAPFMPNQPRDIAKVEASKKKKAADREYEISKRLRDYNQNPQSSEFSISGTPQEKEAQLSALEQAKVGYGQGLQQTGQDIQRVKDLQRQRTEQSGADPVSAAIMAQKASAVANASRSLAASGVKGPAAAGAVDAIARQRDADIAASLYGQQRQSIADERSLASNMLSGTVSMSQGGKAEGTASNMPAPPRSSGLMDSVICTELYAQKLMPLHIYAKDSAYGRALKSKYPEVIIGYHFWAKPVVKLMRTSTIFTFIVKYPALKWANHIAGEEFSYFGLLCQKVGEPMCGLLGKLILKFSGDKQYV